MRVLKGDIILQVGSEALVASEVVTPIKAVISTQVAVQPCIDHSLGEQLVVAAADLGRLWWEVGLVGKPVMVGAIDLDQFAGCCAGTACPDIGPLPVKQVAVPCA